jgi:hypothetical protein
LKGGKTGEELERQALPRTHASRWRRFSGRAKARNFRIKGYEGSGDKRRRVL